ncbi:MAG: hypothetical protein MI747_19980 [Desulfobacterales bacterium]|nr:hypothetical protein [Desulfobacterales bacterium]
MAGPPEKVGVRTWLNFDAFVPTPPDQAPEHASDGWRYKPLAIFSRGGTGWADSRHYPDKPGVYNYFKSYSCTYNNPHMGFETYGFLEIDSHTAVRGNSLRFVATGGVNSKGQHGLAVHSKDGYLKMRARGENPVATGGEKVGHPYLYFMNNTMNRGNTPFHKAQGMNRLSLYVKMPGTIANDGRPPHAPQPGKTMTIGPYNGTGGHWYHDVYNQGGGWTHVLVDGHPNHNNAYHNAQAYPHPSYSVRDMGTPYFDSLHAFYLTFHPYEGIAVPPYSIWVDEIAFLHDPEPQNSETINSPAITWFPRKRSFEIGFSDKYKNNKHSHSQYQVKYAFAPITNANYHQAAPVIIIPDKRFKGMDLNPGGKFKKIWPYYQAVWAPFRLKKEDTDRLVPGTRVYFAVKDLSKRPYETGTFDREGDLAVVPGTQGKRRIDLIKRMDYLIPEGE